MFEFTDGNFFVHGIQRDEGIALACYSSDLVTGVLKCGSLPKITKWVEAFTETIMSNDDKVTAQGTVDDLRVIFFAARADNIDILNDIFNKPDKQRILYEYIQRMEA